MGERGGKRPGAGRKRGSLGKTTVERQAAVDLSGLLPLEYMLQVLRDPEAPENRKDWAATQAAPYIHPKLSAVDVKSRTTHEHIHHVSEADLEHILARRGDGAEKAPGVTH